jgi:hypothetical protein
MGLPFIFHADLQRISSIEISEKQHENMKKDPHIRNEDP